MAIDRKLLGNSETVFALASGGLPCAVAILRVSGVLAFQVARKHFRSAQGEWAPVRGMSFGRYVDAAGETLDDVLLLTFVGPHSFTGEDVIEIQCHGSIAVVAAIEKTFTELGCRAAEAGEFSYRAFHNGRLAPADLETLGDLFQARDTADIARLYRRRDAGLETEIAAVRHELVRLQAILDTAVDFSEEYSHVVDAARQPLTQAIERCAAIAARYGVFRQAALAPRLVMAGRPNAGKSSLFNALLCRYRAIVHESAGTTRDAIEEDVEFHGRRWKVVDTAGLREGQTTMEREGIEQSHDYLEASSVWALVVDGTQGLTPVETELLERFGHKPHVLVWNKNDLPGFQPPPVGDADCVSVSALSGAGLSELAAVVKRKAQGVENTSGVLPSLTQSKRLASAEELLRELEESLRAGQPPEVLGEKNRAILRSIDSVVGEVGIEDVLDRVFSEFCIGK